MKHHYRSVAVAAASLILLGVATGFALTPERELAEPASALGNILGEGYGQPAGSVFYRDASQSAVSPTHDATRASGWDLKGSFNVLTPTYVGAIGHHQAFYGTLDTETGKMKPIYSGYVYTLAEDRDFESGGVRDGILYIPDYSEDMVTREITISWRRIDLATGEILEPINFGGNTAAFFYTMTYDEDADLFYGLGVDFTSGIGGKYVIMDPKTWEVTDTGVNVGGRENSDFMCSLAYNPLDKTVYGLDVLGNFYSIEPLTGAKTKVVSFTEACCRPTEYMSSAMVYSPLDKTFVSIYINMLEQRMQLFKIDAETLEVELGDDLDPVGFVSSIFCSDQFAPDPAPAIITDLKTEMAGPALTGTYSLTVPSRTFANDEIDKTKQIPLTVEIDGTLLETRNVTPGQKVTGSFTTTEGSHRITAYTSIDEDRSPVAKHDFYAGYDYPKAPSGLSLEGRTLSWTASGKGGVHGGYLNDANVAYNIYQDGVLLNSTPVRGTSYDITFPDKLEHHLLTVKAIADDHESAASDMLDTVFGPGMQLPVKFEPTAAEAELFMTVDVDGDGEGKDRFNKFIFTEATDTEPNSFCIFPEQYYMYPEDWLILPLLKFDNAGIQYNLEFDYKNYLNNSKYQNSMQIFVGKSADITKMKQLIYSHEAQNPVEPTHISANFVVPEAGEYYIAIRSYKNHNDTYPLNRGIRIWNFEVSPDNSSTSEAPAAVADARLVPGPKGALKGDVEFILPTATIAGGTLPVNEDIAVRVITEKGEYPGSGKPGDKLSVEVEFEGNGAKEVSIFPSSAKGNGLATVVKGYIGLDAPTAPINIRGNVSADNMSMLISWDAPTTGVNGGYIDPEDLTYTIYLYNSSTSYIKVGETRETSFNYEINNETQANYYVGPTAKNSMGESTNSMFLSELMGAPYEVPMVEEWGSTAFNLTSWSSNTTGSSSDAPWESVSSLNGLGYGDPVFNGGGALMASNQGNAACTTELSAPKATTKGVSTANVKIRFWNCRQAAKMELWGRTDKDQTFRKVAELMPSQDANEWVDWKVMLPEDFQNQGWIQINVRGQLASTDEVIILDSYAITQDVDVDFKLSYLEGPETIYVGDEAVFSATVVNAGTETGRAKILLEFIGDGNVIDTMETSTTRITSNNSYISQTRLPVKQEYLDYGKLEFRATCSIDGDEVPNNNSRTIEFKVLRSPYAVVGDLRGAMSEQGNDVTLSWSTPDVGYGVPESFENNLPFVNNDYISYWRTLDLDGMTQFVINGLRWDGDEDPSSWQVYNAEQKGTMNDPRLSPHSGKQMLIARSVGYDVSSGEKPTQSNDWLISPEIVGGTTVSFWMNIPSSDYSETVELWWSPVDSDPDINDYDVNDNGTFIRLGDWTRAYVWTKSGNDLWEQISGKLPANAKYFALVYRSWGQFFAAIDDIDFTPVQLPEWIVDGYDVTRTRDNSQSTLAEGVKGNTYSLNDHKDGDIYNVYTLVRNEEGTFRSPASNDCKPVLAGIDGIGTDLTGGYVASGKGVIVIGNLAGTEAAIYAADGKLIRVVNVAGDRDTISIEPGVYIVKAGGRAVKLMVN